VTNGFNGRQGLDVSKKKEIARGKARRIQFKNLKLSEAAKEEIKALLSLPDDAAEYCYELIERHIRVSCEGDMNPKFKLTARSDVETKVENLRSALSAVLDCPTTLRALDWVYCCEGGKGWQVADLPRCNMPDLRQAAAELRGIPVVDNLSRFESISLMEMLSHISKTCELSAKPVEVVEQVGRGPDGKRVVLKTKVCKTAAAATVARGKGNPGLSWGEICFSESIAELYEVIGGTFTQQQNQGFDMFLRCVFSAIDPKYPEEANHSALLKAVASMRKKRIA